MLSETDKKLQHAIKNFIIKQYKCSTDAEAFCIMKRLANESSGSRIMCKAFISNGLPCSRRAQIKRVLQNAHQSGKVTGKKGHTTVSVCVF